jgi:Fur family transcriptional regulator, ferric uptake regulator
MERKTRQRDSIQAVFLQAGRPLSAREVLEAAVSVAPGLGIATVYRAIKALVEEAWLEVVELPGEPPRYEPAGKEHHDHFRCRKCTRVYEVDECPVVEARLPSGFVLEGHAAILSGLCAACAPAARATGRGRLPRGARNDS